MASAAKRVSIAIGLWLIVLFLSSVLSAALTMYTMGSPLGVWLVPFGTHSTMAILAIAFILTSRAGLSRNCGFTLRRGIKWIRVVLWSVGVGGIAAVVGAILPYPPIPDPFDGDLLKTILLVWIYASICEEILVRGLVQGYLEPLRDRGLTVGGVHLSLPVICGAILFAIMHVALLTLGAHPVQVLVVQVFALFLGLIAGYFREASGSLIPAIMVHSIFNIMGWLIPDLIS